MIFLVNSLSIEAADKSESEEVRKIKKDDYKKTEGRVKGGEWKEDACSTASSSSSCLRPLEEEVYERVRHLSSPPYLQQERMLRLTLLALRLSQPLLHAEKPGGRQTHTHREVIWQGHRGLGERLQQAMVEEVLRTPRPTLLAALLVPPLPPAHFTAAAATPAVAGSATTVNVGDEHISSPFYLRLTVRGCAHAYFSTALIHPLLFILLPLLMMSLAKVYCCLYSGPYRLACAT